jgi:catechol 2,3-dioxygenase-like lactoylglutathione lyase family enzyme
MPPQTTALGAAEREANMPITELDHYFVRCRDIERSRSFYCDALGFEVMPRPNFPFPGYWLGVGGKVQVHMGSDKAPQATAHYFGTSAASARENSGVVDHIAFQGTDAEGMAQRLTKLGLPARIRHIAEISLLQIFVADPDGLMIELNFPGVAEAPAWAPSSLQGRVSAPMTRIARGEFVVKLLPLAVEGQPEGSGIGRMSIDKSISGDLVATTTGQMLSAMTEVKGSAGYVAIERVDGVLDGRKGTFVLQHTGTMNRGAPGLSVTVVPDSGTGELEGLAGEFRIVIAEGRHSYEFSYSLPQP